ncbi:nSTAND1 domain-containing NTPase [Agromyces binzhouensis]|uniref:nSTAND1 domain-containing NTPase n=1 Tax=Agromyces binzhouensis TaxID=1817495 RepID=UPI00362E2D37
MEIRAFGDLAIDGGRLSPKERALLAALVLDAGRPVTPAALADAVWGDDLPATWPKQVQAAVGFIRRALGASAITTSRAGYRLDVSPDAIDVVRYEQLVADARDHREQGDPARAIDLLDRAESLWRGAPYANLDTARAAAEAERLGEIRLTAAEDALTARLECGEHRAVVPDAERLVRAEPLRERRWAILATALYQGGRQAEALASLRLARTRLADDLGIEPGAELVDLEAAILRQDPTLDAPAATGGEESRCPYRGLEAYGPGDQEEFFGRDDDIRAALDRIERSMFLAVSGPSGCGKSSLLLAGVVPSLRARGRTVTVIRSPAASIERLRGALDASATDVLVIDQFEELFHAGLDDSGIDDVAGRVAAMTRAGTKVVIAVRSDFLDDCTSRPILAPLFADGVHLVGPLTENGLRAAIEEPARLASLRLEPGLVELILRDTAGEPAGVLPHVSHALVETWMRREGRTMTVAGYEASGGIAGAIAQSADRLYSGLDEAEREVCRTTLLRLVSISPEALPVRRRVALKTIREDPARAEIVERLEFARLVSSDQDSVVVSHESLALAWPRLRRWLEADAEGAKTMTAIAAAAEAWDADGRPDDELFVGARLQAALEWRTATNPELMGVESAFLDTSAAKARAAADALAERARHDRRQNRLLRGLLATAVALVVIAAGSGVLVAIGAAETERQRTQADIEALTSTSLSFRGTERDVAALLAVEAYHRWPDDARTRSALLGAMTASHGLVGATYVEGVERMTGVVVPGTRHAVLATSAQEVGVFDVESGDLIRPLDVPKLHSGVDSRMGPTVSGDGGRMALAEREFGEQGPTGIVRITVADVATGDRVVGPIEVDASLSSITIDGDGATIAALDETGGVRLVDAGDGTVRTVAGTTTHEPELDTNRAGVVRFAPDGRLLYGTLEGPLLVIDPTSATVVDIVRMPAASTNVSMSLLPDGRVITTGDRRIALVDPAAKQVTWSQVFATRLDSPCVWVAAAASLGTVYCADSWGSIEERSLETGAPTDRAFSPQLGFVGPLALSESGRELIVIGRGNPAITRWMLDGSGAVTRVVAPGWSILDRYSSSGASLLVGRRTDDLGSWEDYREFAVLDARTGEITRTLPTPSYGVRWVGSETLLGDIGGLGEQYVASYDIRTSMTSLVEAFPRRTVDVWANADGRRMYVGTETGDILTYDSTTGRRVEPTLHADAGLFNVTTNPDGSEVLVTSAKGFDPATTTVFDADTGERLRTGLEGFFWTTMTARGEIIAATNNRIVRFDAETMERIGSLPGVPGGIDEISVSPDGRTLSVYAMNETVSVYDLVGGIRLGDPIPVSGEFTMSGPFGANGDEMAVNVPGGIALWDLRPSAQAEAACAMAGRDLTRDEWGAYLGDVDEYRSTCGFGTLE